jgi:cell division topological specificity factor
VNLLSFFQRRSNSAPVARERLQILLAHERAITGKTDLVAILREEILAVIAKHVPIDPDQVQVKMDRNNAVSTLEVDIQIPIPGEVAKAAETENAAKPSADGGAVKPLQSPEKAKAETAKAEPVKAKQAAEGAKLAPDAKPAKAKAAAETKAAKTADAPKPNAGEALKPAAARPAPVSG